MPHAAFPTTHLTRHSFRLTGDGPPSGGPHPRLRPTLTAHLLGALRVSLDGRVVDTVSSRRTRQLIAYLLTHRRSPVPRDVLMQVFWPEASPAAARNSLHVALSGVRRVLREAYPEPVIDRRFDAYRIADSVDVWTDVEQFELASQAGRRAEWAGDRDGAERHYETAGQLYQGDFLADDPYLDWAIARREALRVQAVEIQSRLVDIYAGRGDYGPASNLARRILDLDPCNERLHRALMISYAGSGQRHLALFQYHQLSASLWAALRVRPSDETAALYERLRQPPALRRPA